MRFSVITITFNAEKFLESTLESAAQQRGVTWEHILWDGGSEDRTLSIANTFESVRIIEGKDRGIADAMNLAASHARGDFLIYLHADDIFPHSQVLLMIDRALRLHPETEWLYGKAHMIDEIGSILRTTSYEPFAQKRLRKYNFITHPAAAVSRSLFLKTGGFNHLKYCMDYDLWLRMGRLSTPLVVPSVLACFRQHNLSLSTRDTLQVADEAYLVRNRYVTSLYERFRSYRTWKRRREHILRG